MTIAIRLAELLEFNFRKMELPKNGEREHAESPCPKIPCLFLARILDSFYAVANSEKCSSFSCASCFSWSIAAVTSERLRISSSNHLKLPTQLDSRALQLARVLAPAHHVISAKNPGVAQRPLITHSNRVFVTRCIAQLSLAIG